MTSSHERRPEEGQHAMADVVAGLARRVGLPGLEQWHRSVAAVGLFALVNGALSIALLAGLAALTGQPFVFPALGPIAFLLFYAPTGPPASPRNTILGNLIGVIAGYLSLLAFGLLDAGSFIGEGVTGPRIGAAALSLGLTAGFMVWLRTPNPPAGATTMIVSLGLITSLAGLVVIMLGVVLLVAQAMVINRLAGIPYPWWSPRPTPGAGHA